MSATPTSTDFTTAEWQTSTYSGSNNDCVEHATSGAYHGVRDTKDENRTQILVFGDDAWKPFLASL